MISLLSLQELVNTGIFTIAYGLVTLFHLIFAVKTTSNIFAAVSICYHKLHTKSYQNYTIFDVFLNKNIDISIFYDLFAGVWSIQYSRLWSIIILSTSRL